MTDTNVPITVLQPSDQQHMLLLFLPVIKGAAGVLAQSTNTLLSAPEAGPDLRAATGVHFFMVTAVANGAASTLPVPTFQAAEGKDLFVVLSIYDAPFTPYISAFTSNFFIAAGLNKVLEALDESGIVEPTDPTSAAYILSHGGVFKNAPNFIKLLLRYNFADPAIPAATSKDAIANPQPNPKYFLGGTFPGLTIGSILQNYPNAAELWPQASVPITFVPAVTAASSSDAPAVPVAGPAIPIAAAPPAAPEPPAEPEVPAAPELPAPPTAYRS